jgi:hypothetical protein
MGRSLVTAVIAALVLGVPFAARAWIYPEHRDLALLAVQGLDEDRRAVFDRLWEEASTGIDQHLCAAGADSAQGVAPTCIDWAAMSAISGDHSCSSREMFDTASGAPWILQVAGVAAQLKADLAHIQITARPESIERSGDLVADTQRRIASEAARAERVNALRNADLQLQRADHDYATRAGANNAHFLLARPDTTSTLDDYVALTLHVGANISAIGVYSWFHLSAMQKATRLANEPQLEPAERDALARAVLSDEAFALHFLEDVFSAGHIAGTWGDASQRQGTHDYYNQNGLEVFTWAGGSRSIVLMGDAYMRPEDAQIAAASVRTSLEQVLDIASGRPGHIALPYTPAAPAVPDDFNVCRNNKLPQRPEGVRVQPGELRIFEATLAGTPVPGLGPGFGALPRFRSEVGPFIGLSGAIDGRLVDGGFVESQTQKGGVAGLDLSFRAGFGLDGVMGDAGDGLVFGSVGLRSDGPSTNRVRDTEGSFGGHLGAAIPARSGLALRLRMPFYLIPGDLLLLSPLYFADRDAYTSMAVAAANGGLIPWQSGWATAIGRFQFVLGREIGITFYGLSGTDQLIAPGTAPGEPFRIVNFKSIAYDLPIFEYRPYRAFSTNQSSSVLFQLYTSVDVPRSASTAFPAGASTPDMRTVWSIGLRLVFDWRYYY